MELMKMDYEKKQEKLSMYILNVRKLERKCNELNTWSELGQIRGGTIAVNQKVNANNRGIDNIHGTAMTIAQEVEDLALYVNELRAELNDALTAMPTIFLREVLEGRYIFAKSINEMAKEYKYSPRHIRRKVYEGISELEKVSLFFQN